MIAALFVQRGGVYYGLAHVDPWDKARDARAYAGPWPVVAHPPCARWSRLATHAFGRPTGKKVGDDGGCFAAALAAVKRWGGVVEHPASSKAWRAHGLLDPVIGSDWTPAGDLLGWTVHVEQGHYGHRLPKATWLYAVAPRAALPRLPGGKSAPVGFTSTRHGEKGSAFTSLSARQRSATPIAFRDLLIRIAEAGPAPCWVPCDCGEFWCARHGDHAFACDCPPIEDWPPGVNPYAPSDGACSFSCGR